ncbi:hypothetical protein VZ95_02840 [Elstera litoralis]|uniref:Tail terminator n=1 Tax=Elstera litoralis TaxID=552518 RepID=A0A0F3IVT8_9PROT|nr:hypothetical protein [Elstera litoralis]KJV10747.1 hypothetical protein VZ95_02840 [Elstera litoralis]
MSNPPVPVWETIVQALEARLRALEWPGLTVERNRTVEVSADECPFLALYEADEDEPEEDSAAARKSSGVEIELYLQAPRDHDTPGAALGADLNGLIAMVEFAVLEGTNQSPSWWPDGTVDIRRGAISRTLETGETSLPSGGAKIEFTVDYWTRPGDPYTPGP